MRTPLSWLRDFAPFQTDLATMAATLDELGLVVEGIERVGEGLGDVSVARVTEIGAIEGADRIRRVVVDAGDGAVEVVCGAFNFGEGDLVPLVRAGAVLPGGVEIARRTMRGVVSDGMLCSGRELGLTHDGEGLLILTDIDGAVPGQPLTDALGIEPDVIFDITVEGNRPDAWCMAGIARDLAAALHVPFSMPEPGAGSGVAGPAVETLASAVVEAPELCPRLTVRVATNVTVGPSPRWLARRLLLAGMRPINNVVDASNYVMLELGQPTHPYDLDRLGGAGLRIRRARRGELLTTLDGVRRTLGVPGTGLGETGEDCVICDADDTVVGVAGIMGGESSEISPATRRVLLEAAYFSPMAIARTGKRLRLRTEASARFERGCDPWGIDRATDRFFALLSSSSPSLSVAAGTLDVRGEVPRPVVVPVAVGAVNALLGTALSSEQVTALLEPLGFACTPAGETGESDLLTVAVPTNRPDIRPAPEGVADVAEEVARTFGYSRIDRHQPTWPEPGGLSDRQRDRRLVRQVLFGLGASEAWTPSFVADEDHRRIGLGGPAVEVTNPLVTAERFLRRAQLPGLLRALAYNADRRQGAISLFEIGTVFSMPDDSSATATERAGAGGARGVRLPVERELLSAVFGDESSDARHAVAAWHVLRETLGLVGVRAAQGEGPAGAGLHPSRSAQLVEGSAATPLGTLGEVDPSVVASFGLGERRVGWLEVDLGRLLDRSVVSRRSELSRPVSRYPSSDIDLALVVRDEVPADRVAEELARAGGDLLESVTLFDVFRGASVPEGSRSLAFRLRFGALDRTLTDGEVGELRRACVDAVLQAVGATLR
ncbi:MAG TPA: phenylalanine--tRNA ligase subunit beta [Acidimicrobiales bacterium]|nr:phenylalanine--tRNA ligase subunit beta [Acidimicrobiales bacterium]